MEIEFILSQNDMPLIRLTEHTIQNLKFITAKTHKYIRQTRDITMRLKFENAAVLIHQSSSEQVDNENEDEKPDEIETIRDLLEFAVSSYRKQLAYLDGSLSIVNESGQIFSYSYRNLFVLTYSEEFTRNTGITSINIHMREKARSTLATSK